MFGKVIGLIKEAFASTPQTGLASADVAAIGKDVALAAGSDAALGKALLAYVLSGTPESALLQLKSISPQDRLTRYNGGDWQVSQGRHKVRQAIYVELKGWDALAIRRYGEILAISLERDYYAQFFLKHPSWPSWLAVLAYGYGQSMHSPTDAELGIVAIPRLREMLALDQKGTAELLDGLYGANPGWNYLGTPKPLTGNGLLAPLVDAEPSAAVIALGRMNAEHRTKFIAKLAEMDKIKSEPILDAVLPMAADSSKAARIAAMAALQGVDKALLRQKAVSMLAAKESDTRLAGVRILGTMAGADSADQLRTHAAGEKSKKIVQAIDEVLAAFQVIRGDQRGAATGEPAGQGEGYVSVDGQFIALPPRPAIGPDRILPAQAVTLLREAMIAQTERNRDADEKHRLAYPLGHRTPPTVFDPTDAPIIIRLLNGQAVSSKEMAKIASVSEHLTRNWQTTPLGDSIDKIFAMPEATLHHAVRLIRWRRHVDSSRKLEPQWLLGQCAPAMILFCRFMREGTELRVIADTLDADIGRSLYLPERIRTTHLTGTQFEYADLDPNIIWPWIAERFDDIDQAIPKIGDTSYYDQPDPLMLISLLPAPPQRYLQTLTDIAISGAKDHRLSAKAALAEASTLTPLIAGLLKSGEQGRRASAAHWLAERGDNTALPALREAIASERSDHARAAILSAMSDLGEDISRFFSDEVLLAEAKKALPKLKSKLGEWLPDSAIPDVAWADGRTVPRDIIRYWLLLSEKLKLPGGNPMLAIGLDRLKPADAGRLGLTILSAYIDYDTVHPSEASANAHANANAAARHQAWVKYQPGYTFEKAFSDIKREMQGAYLNSATPHNGILALAIRAPGADAARMARAFLKNNSSRTSQCRAVLDCLAANPSPAAIQLVLAISRRHKTPGVQKHAGDLVARIAENNNWTAEELSDRTVPTAGFDEDGVMELEIGERVFRAVLDGECKILLENPDGKAIAALPSPTGEAEAEQANACKKLVSNARKEAKQTVEMQTAQLYEAMCSARTWSCGDFDLFILRHPILGRLVTRLVFAGLDQDGKTVSTFRIMDDKSLTDAADRMVDISTFAGIRVAHTALVPARDSAAWQTHFADYELTPLFQQFGRPAMALTPENVEDNVIIDRRGYMIETFKLRGIAVKLGYQRGQAEDGGVFTQYEKRFASAGITAMIDFTGSALPEENVASAITGMRFVKAGKNSSWGKALAPQNIPPVLLSEVWNDVHRMAEQGSGFAADWQKKAFFG